jgi:hypothetical protein
MPIGIGSGLTQLAIPMLVLVLPSESESSCLEHAVNFFGVIRFT